MMAALDPRRHRRRLYLEPSEVEDAGGRRRWSTRPTTSFLEAAGYVIADLIIASTALGCRQSGGGRRHIGGLWQGARRIYEIARMTPLIIVGRQAGVTAAVAKADMAEYDFVPLKTQLTPDWLGAPGTEGNSPACSRAPPTSSSSRKASAPPLPSPLLSMRSTPAFSPRPSIELRRLLKAFRCAMGRAELHLCRRSTISRCRSRRAATSSVSWVRRAGCKTTLLQTLAGFLPPSTGQSGRRRLQDRGAGAGSQA